LSTSGNECQQNDIMTWAYLQHSDDDNDDDDDVLSLNPVTSRQRMTAAAVAADVT